MHTKVDLKDMLGENIVYVRPVDVADLPKDVQQSAMGMDRLFAVHNADGERLALVRDEKLAFILARQNDLSAVRVH